MRVTPDQMDDWKTKAKAFQEAHPQHCGVCGLPLTHCYHLDARYRSEIDKCLLDHPRDYRKAAEVQNQWYLRALDRMGVEQVNLLPEPPKARFGDLLRKWLHSQTSIPTWYDRILSEGTLDS